jgi:prepilin peptidase CpaA
MPALASVQAVTMLLLSAGVILLLAAALHDVATRTIPNGTVLGIAGIGIAWQGLSHTLSAGLTAGAVVLVAGLLCWRCGLLGGGDAKLTAAASLMVPAHEVIPQVLAIAIAGGWLSMVYLILRRLLRTPGRATETARRSIPARILRVEHRRLRRGITLPYAAAIAAGTLFVLWRG